MKAVQQINRLQLVDKLIRQECTGSANEFSNRLGISRATWFVLKKELTEYYNFPISYCKRRKTYFYTDNGKLNLLTFHYKKEDNNCII